MLRDRALGASLVGEWDCCSIRRSGPVGMHAARFNYLDLDMKLTLAERFLLLRRRSRMTQTVLGGLLRVSRRTVCRIERDGGTKVGGSKLRELRERFEILEKRQAGR